MTALSPHMPAPQSRATRAEAEAAFERRMALVTEAIDTYHNSLLAYLYGFTRHWQDAENLLQDLWKYVLLHFRDDEIGHLPALKNRAKRLFIDAYRKARRRGEVVSDAIAEQEAAPPYLEPVSEAEEARLKENFWREFPGIELSVQEKEVIWLHARYGFTYAEIEERTGVASSTVGDWIARARRLLADYLNNER